MRNVIAAVGIGALINLSVWLPASAASSDTVVQRVVGFCVGPIAESTMTPWASLLETICTQLVSAAILADATDGGSTAPGPEQGCAIALAMTAGTPGQEFVQAACAQVASVVPPIPPIPPIPAVPPVPPIPVEPTSDVGARSAARGCAIAISQTAGTPGQAFVQASCAHPPGTGSTSDVGQALGAQARAAGCAIAVARTAGTRGQAFVQAGCAGGH